MSQPRPFRRRDFARNWAETQRKTLSISGENAMKSTPVRCGRNTGACGGGGMKRRRENVMTSKRKVVGEVTEKVEPLALAIEALVSAMLMHEKHGKEYQGLEPARAQLRKALSGAIHGV
jgi:hypothetical protein